MINNHTNKTFQMLDFQAVNMQTGVFVNGRNYDHPDSDNKEEGSVADFMYMLDKVFGQQIQLELEVEFNKHDGEWDGKVLTSGGKYEIWIA